MPAPEVEAALASVSDAAAQARAFKIAVASAGEEEGREGGAGGAGGAGRGGGGRARESSGGNKGGGPRSKASSCAGTTVEVGPLSDAAACRIALRDC